jgi:hypothetical protein
VGLHVIVQQFILSLAWIVSAFLLAGFAYGFYKEMSLWLSVPFLGLVIISLLVGGANVASFVRRPALKEGVVVHRWALLPAMPLAYFAASLDCTGLSALGCTPFCTFIKSVWVPLLAIICGLWLWRLAGRQGRGESAFPVAILVMSLVPVAPHCVCYNPGNGMWIEMLGSSPVCYVWGLTVAVISVSAILSGKRVIGSALVCWIIICGAVGFFAAHHFFHFPW